MRTGRAWRGSRAGHGPGLPLEAAGWGRARLMGILAAVAATAVVLLAGLGYAVVDTLTRPPSAPVATAADVVAGGDPVTPGAARSAGRGEPGAGSAARRDAITAESMLEVGAEAAAGGTPAASPPPVIEVPPATSTGPAGVPSGFPRTPAGAVGQLGAIVVTVAEAMSIPTAHAVHDAWAAPGGVSAGQWEMTRNVQSFLAGAGMGHVKALGTRVVAVPVAGQVKGSDGPDWVVACVLIDLQVRVSEDARVAYGHCERMAWTGDRWRIAPGQAPARAPSTWPGSELSVRAGWRTWVETAPTRGPASIGATGSTGSTEATGWTGATGATGASRGPGGGW